MVFYDKNGNKHVYNIEESSFLDEGTQAKIYRVSDNECIKVLKNNTDKCFEDGLFDDLKKLELNGLVKLGIPFYRNENIYAYTMEYLVKSKRSIIDMPTEYTLDNLNLLYKSLQVLASNLIMAKDLYHKNMLVGESKITIIDLDGYKKMSYNDDILWHNTNNLLYAFKRLYEEELKKMGIDMENKRVGGMNINDYLSYLFDYKSVKEEPAKVLERKLIGTRTPRELFDRKW